MAKNVQDDLIFSFSRTSKGTKIKSTFFGFHVSCRLFSGFQLFATHSNVNYRINKLGRIFQAFKSLTSTSAVLQDCDAHIAEAKSRLQNSTEKKTVSKTSSGQLKVES